MNAVVLRELGEPEVLRVEPHPDPEPGPGDVVVRLRAAALNHRDIWIRRGRYPGTKFPVILGSDGAGDVIEVGPGVERSVIGRSVVVNPALDWGPDPRAQGAAFQILGLPRDGTYAERVRVPAANVYEKPSHLSFEEAAAIPLASVTAFRALVTRGRLRSGESVLLTGIGGGVASSALTLAKALGASVYVTSGSDEKIAKARAIGAIAGVNHSNPDWPATFLKEVGRRPDLVIDGAGGETFNRALDLLPPGGRMVAYGATRGPAETVEVRRIFWKQLDVLGTTMGTTADFEAMLALYAGGLHPVVDSIFPMSDAAGAHRRMEMGLQFGKIVLTT